MTLFPLHSQPASDQLDAGTVALPGGLAVARYLTFTRQITHWTLYALCVRCASECLISTSGVLGCSVDSGQSGAVSEEVGLRFEAPWSRQLGPPALHRSNRVRLF